MSTAQVLALALPAAVVLLLLVTILTWRVYGWLADRNERSST